VLAVGPVVRDNLLNLGHLDLKADGRTEPKLPGDVCVRVGDLPLLDVGDTFRITRPGTSKEQDQ
jgi:PTS system glucitol/sorbitol-specific IIA component